MLNRNQSLQTTPTAHIRLGVCDAMMWVVLHAPFGPSYVHGRGVWGSCSEDASH